MSTVEGWASSPLDNLMVTKNDKAKQVKSTEYSTVGTYPIVDQSSDFICGYHEDSKKVIDANLPLTVFGDHTRHTKFVSFSFIAGADGTQLLKPEQEIEDKFFYYLVSNAAEKIGNFGYDRHFKHLKEYVCNFPTNKSEQTKIAEILSTVDRAIEQTEALIAKQQRIKTGLMQDLLTRGIDEHGNLRSEQTHEFKDSPLGRIPVEWEVVLLSYFVKRLDAGISVNSDDKPCGSGQIGVLKTSALNKGDFLPEQNKTVLQIEENRVRFSPTANTILISRMNTPDLVGESGFVDKDFPHLFLPDRIWMTIFQDGKEKVARWLSFVMTSPHARSYITLNATGTSGSMKNLSKASLFKMPLRAPTDPEEQQQIARLLECQNIQIGQMRQSLEKLRSLKTALMQDLLTGKKRVTALLNNTEVARA